MLHTHTYIYIYSQFLEWPILSILPLVTYITQYVAFCIINVLGKSIKKYLCGNNNLLVVRENEIWRFADGIIQVLGKIKDFFYSEYEKIVALFYQKPLRVTYL